MMGALRRLVPRSLAMALLLTVLTSHIATAQKRVGTFTDPDDGRVDLSDYLLTRKGFLPVPIIVTEPALGYGGSRSRSSANRWPKRPAAGRATSCRPRSPSVGGSIRPTEATAVSSACSIRFAPIGGATSAR